MKHCYLRFILLCLCLHAGMNAFAYDAEIDGIYYDFSGNEATVTNKGNNNYSGTVVIPESVTYNGKPYSVTSIGSYAFSWCSLTSITIPNSITSINDNSFQGCGLTSMIIPNSVTNLGNFAFYYCEGLTTITIGNSVKSIGDCAFEGCINLTSVTIGNSVTSIGEAAFQNCPSLTAVTIPNSVTKIGVGAFEYCRGLTSVTIPNYVTSIGSSAFADCNNLTSVIIGNNMKSISAYAFAECSELADVYSYAEDVPSTNSYAFDVSPISSATLHVPAGSLEAYSTTEPWSGFGTIVAIEDDSPSIIFADANVKTLCVANWDTNGDGELSEAEAAAVTDLGTTFRNNKQIGSFDELQYFTGLTSINNNAFRGCSGLATIIIPDNVTSIGDDAFSGCTSLTTITIPSGVISIGEYALSNCSSLTSVYCYAEAVPSASDVTFDDTNIGTATLYVPKASLTLYKTTAPWSYFGTIVPIEGYTTYNINDEMASLNIAAEESGCIVALTHDFNAEWEAIYLPFAIDYDAIKADFDLAEIDGVVQNDENNDGIIDFTVLSIRGFKEQMTEPNTPYLIRAKNAGNQTISFDDITVYPTEEATFDCSSFSTKYEFTGSYNALDALALAERYSIQNGELVKGTSSLAPCRWYMTATSRKGAPLNLPNKIRIMSVDEVITGVSPLGETEEGTVIYNLNGQRLTKPQKGINIQNGWKVLLK